MSEDNEEIENNEVKLCTTMIKECERKKALDHSPQLDIIVFALFLELVSLISINFRVGIPICRITRNRTKHEQNIEY